MTEENKAEKIIQIIPTPAPWRAEFLYYEEGDEHETRETAEVACIALTEGGDIVPVCMTRRGNWYDPREDEGFTFIMADNGGAIGPVED